MPANRFFLDEPLEIGKTVRLEGPEEHHLRHVMRVEAGDELELIDGRGTLAHAELVAFEKRASLLRIMKLECEKMPERKLTLVVPLMRPAKLEWVIEKGTELGASAFLLYHADQGDLKTLSAHATERLHHVMIAAIKQSGRLFLPDLRNLQKLEELENETVLFGDVREEAPWIQPAGKVSISFVTGPERGFSEREERVLEQLGHGVRLNAYTLRAETAPIVAASVLSLS